MANANVKIAVDYAVSMSKFAKPKATIAMPMFEGATKHDVELVKKGLTEKIRIGNIQIDKRMVIITLA
jgi:hypothetical protein